MGLHSYKQVAEVSLIIIITTSVIPVFRNLAPSVSRAATLCCAAFRREDVHK